jgi:Transposase domain (DUF772)
VLLYGYCIGVRSSRQLERHCHEDIAFRVLTANQTPDHVTIARLRWAGSPSHSRMAFSSPRKRRSSFGGGRLLTVAAVSQIGTG